MSGKQFTRGKGCNNRKLSDEDRGEIVRLYTTPLPDGTWMGVTTIAKQFGVSHNAIQYRLKRSGITLRTAKEAHAHGKRCKPITSVPLTLAPACACGCRDVTEWNQRRNRWNRYAVGHYRLWAPYKDAEWLRTEYVRKRRTAHEIAAECGVSHGVVLKAMEKSGIPRRSRSESRIGRMVGEKNPAWKGGVADWDYAAGWKVIARKIRDRDEWTCQDCGEQRNRWGHSLHVHHIDEDKLNNDPANLISLCASCHRAVHRKEVMPS